MKSFLFLVLFFLVSCGVKVYTPDHKATIDNNTLRIELLEAQDRLHKLKLDDLESRLSIYEVDILSLFGLIDSLESRIDLLEIDLQSQIDNLDSRLSTNEININTINQEIDDINILTTSLQNQINTVSDNVTRVIKPCDSSEILLDTQDGVVGYFQNYKNVTINIQDDLTVEAYTIPAHFEKYCVDTNFFDGECNTYETRLVGEHTIPAKTYQIGDTATIKVIKDAYLSLLPNGNYRTTATPSCNFTVVDGGVQ